MNGGPSWMPDPTGRHALRFWDGGRWTEHVSDQPEQSAVDPVSGLQTPPPVVQLPAAAPAGNGLAVAALVLGIVGVIVGLIPLFFWIALPCGILAVIFGFAGRRRGRRGMVWTGIITGTLAIVLGVVGPLIVNDAFEDLDRELDEVGVVFDP
jgi:hypothetical protein